MGQVTSVSLNSDNYYTVNIKPFKDLNTLISSGVDTTKCIRYTVANNIIQKITSINLKNKETNLANPKTALLLSFLTMTFCENIPQLCDTYDSSKPSYVYIYLGENKDNKDLKDLKSTIYYLENDLDPPIKPLKMVDPPNNYLYNISPCLPNTSCGNVDLSGLGSFFSMLGLGVEKGSQVSSVISMCCCCCIFIIIYLSMNKN
jgi:hypothetical protein